MFPGSRLSLGPPRLDPSTGLDCPLTAPILRCPRILPPTSLLKVIPSLSPWRPSTTTPTTQFIVLTPRSHCIRIRTCRRLTVLLLLHQLPLRLTQLVAIFFLHLLLPPFAMLIRLVGLVMKARLRLWGLTGLGIHGVVLLNSSEDPRSHRQLRHARPRRDTRSENRETTQSRTGKRGRRKAPSGYRAEAKGMCPQRQDPLAPQRVSRKGASSRQWRHSRWRPRGPHRQSARVVGRTQPQLRRRCRSLRFPRLRRLGGAHGHSHV